MNQMVSEWTTPLFVAAVLATFVLVALNMGPIV